MDDRTTIRRQPDDPFDPRRLTAHGQAFLTFVYGLLRHQTFAVPPGATADGLAAAFERGPFVETLGELLATFALERLVRATPPVSPEVVLEDGRTVRVAMWDDTLQSRMTGGIHQHTTGLLAQLFLMASSVHGQAATVIDDSREGGREVAEISQWLDGETAKFSRAARRSALAWPRVLARNDSSVVTLGSVPPERLFPAGEPVGPFDLLLLDSIIRAGRDICTRIDTRMGELVKHWTWVFNNAVAVSPLTQLFGEDRIALPRPVDGPRGVAECRRAMAPLFRGGNHYLLKLLEAEVVDAWIEIEQRRLRHEHETWRALIDHFNDIVDALIGLARELDHASVLTTVLRFYNQYVQIFRDEPWVERVRGRMKTFRRFSERQQFADHELAIFRPFSTLADWLEDLKGRNYAERHAEEDYLIRHPLARVERLRVHVRFCREKLALPFATAAGVS